MRRLRLISVFTVVVLICTLGSWGAQPVVTLEASRDQGLGGSLSQMEAARAAFPLQQDRAGASGEWVTDLAPFDPALPLPPLHLVSEGLPEGTTVEVARDEDSPFLPIALRDGRGRIPLAVPDVEALRRLRVRVHGPHSGKLILQPEADFALTPSEDQGLVRITATSWGSPGDLLVSATDARGNSLEPVSEEGRRMTQGAEKWLDFGPLGIGEKAAFMVFPTPSSTWPITVRFLSKTGEVQELSFRGLADDNQRRPEATGVCATPGKDGTGGILTGIINTYYPVTTTVSAGATSVPVGAASGAATAISVGDLLILIQMQDAQIDGTNTSSYGDGVSGGSASGYTALNGSGTYEYVVATGAVSGGSVPIRGAGAGSGTLNAYTVAASSATKGRSSAQIVRVPQYMTATLSSTLTCKAWDGSTGGILAMDVSARLTLNGTTSVSGRGFRGGIQQQLTGQTGVAATDYRILGPANGTTTTGTGGMKGEGIAGTPRLMPNANNGSGLDGCLNGDWYRGGPGNAGGGGNDSTPTTNNENAGGGGGGNGGAGGVGGASWQGNQLIGGYPGAIVTATGGVAVLGGGGGAGARNNLSSGGNGGGGAGGGIVLIRTLTVSGTGAITANGADAPGVTSPSMSDAAGGGGAGGTVLIYAKTGGLSGLSVTAQGGRGGDAWPAQAPGIWPGQHHGPGGGGGGGSILLSSAPGIESVNGGMNGISCTDNDAYGSFPGNLGTVSTTLAEASLPGADPGYLCATPSTYISKSSSAGTGYVGPGQTLTYTIEVTNTTTSAWNGVAVNDPLPANTSFVAASTQVTKVTYPTGNYADSFANQNYSNSTGSLPWSPVWTEQVEADGPLAGNIQVVADPFGGAEYSLLMNNSTTRWIYRALDLSTYSNAALSFRYARYQMTQNDTMTVQVSTNGGGAWTTLKTIKGYYYNSGATSITDSAFLTEYFDLTPYLSANFQIRFYPGTTFANTIYFDDINISAATTTVVNPIGGSPPTLVSGQTLLPGESMTVTFQVTVNDPLDPAATSIDNTATVTTDGGISQPSSVSNPIIPPPAVNSPIYDLDTSISGTSTAPVGSTITVYRTGVSIGTTTVLAGGTWTLAGVSGLVAGDSITAKVTSGGATSGASNTVTVISLPYITKTSSAGTGYVSPGDVITYTVTATNITGANWTNVALTDPLPAGTTWVSTQLTYPTSTSGTYLDQFSLAPIACPGSYQGSNGTLTWPTTTPWIEIGDDGVCNTGDVQADEDGATNNALRLDDFNNGARRAADLSGYTGATVSFTYRRTAAMENDASVFLQISNDNGGSWSVPPVATVTGNSTEDPTYLTSGPHTIDAAYLVAGFQLRFITNGTADEGDECYIDDVQISLSDRNYTSGAGGAPPNLASGYTLYPYESLTAVVTVTVNSDLSPSITQIQNIATVTADGGVSQPATATNPVLPAPVVSSPINAGASSIAGTSAAPVGSTITVYSNGVSIGTTTVQSGGTWTLTGVSGLLGGETITAVGSTSGATSAVSNPVVVTPATPVVTGPIVAGATSVSGTSTAPVGSTITVYVNGTPYTTTVQAGGVFSVTVPPLVAGDEVNATVTAGGQTSGVSNTVTVQHPAPVVSSPILADPASITGTSASPDGTTITVYSNGVALGTTTVSGGTWIYSGPGLSGLIGGEAITATAGTGASESAVSNTVIVTPAAPVIDGPLVEDQTTITGTGVPGASVTVTIGGVDYTTTVQGDGTWSVTVPPLVAPGTVSATQTTGGQTSGSTSAPVHFLPPVVTGPILAGASSISGTSPSPDGTEITVYQDGVAIGTATVTGGNWTLTGVTGLLGGESITAKAGVGTAAESAVSNTVVVSTIPSFPPIVSSSIVSTAPTPQTVYGSSVESPGSVITVYLNGVPLATQPLVQADGSWSLPGVTLVAGDIVSATVLAAGKSVSTLSNQVVVSADATGVTPPPVITSPIPALSTSVSGTSLPNATVDVYADGFYLGTVTADGSGNWTLGPGIAPLASGTIISATATVSGSGTSDWSAPVIVGDMIMLLRSDIMTSLTQTRAPIFTHPVASPPYPSLETIGPNHVFNQTEGPSPQPASPGTLDDDKAYIRNIHSGDLEPEPAVLTDNGRPLVFYELLDNNTKTLKLNKFTDGSSVVHIQFTITP